MEINIDDSTLNQYIENYVERLLERQINHYIQFRLKGVIEARLTALRLHDPTFPSLDDHITEKLSTMVTAKVHGLLQTLVPSEVSKALRRIAVEELTKQLTEE